MATWTKKSFYSLLICFFIIPASGYAQNIPGDSRYQIHTGILNYGYKESIYQQFTGDSVFSGSTSSTSLFENIAWQSISPIRPGGNKNNVLPAWSYGFELFRITETSQSALRDQTGTIVAPSVDMEVFFANFNLKGFLVNDPFEDTLHIFVGAGWGTFWGTFNSQTSDGNNHNTSFQGLFVYRTFGVQTDFGEDFGLLLEVRDVSTSEAKTSNDPFVQNTNSSNGLRFSGSMVNVTGYFRF